MTDEAFISSREPAKNGYGQNGDATPSSILPGNIAPPDASADPGSWQTRPVSSAQAVPTRDSMGTTPHPVQVPPNGRPVVKR
jgi:hypothetical protein